MLARTRQFLRSDMKVLRWVFLALYAMLLAALISPWLFETNTVLVAPIPRAGESGPSAQVD